MKKFFIKTFGCIQNTIDSDLIRNVYINKGFEEVSSFKKSDVTIIDSCVVRESAENRVYGLIEEIRKFNRKEKRKIKIIVSGCLVGWKNKNKHKNNSMKNSFADVSFLDLSKITDGHDENLCVVDKTALISISWGCNNYCSYCVVPFARGKERSAKFETILKKANIFVKRGVKKLLLVGQNVNSYGSDLVDNTGEICIDGKRVKAVMIKSMGKKRIPSLFPYLLSELCKLDFEKVSFVSSNPWDFSDELIEVIKNNKNVDRLIHLPIQAGDNQILAKMNRAYTVEEYMELVDKIRSKINDVKISTDIIIGFPGETDKIFEKSFEVYKKINFDIAYLNKYSPRSGTLAYKMYVDDIPASTKKQRWKRLDNCINKKIL